MLDFTISQIISSSLINSMKLAESGDLLLKKFKFISNCLISIPACQLWSFSGWKDCYIVH